MANLIPVDLNWTPILAKTMYWLGYGLAMCLMMGVFVAIFFVMQYRIKAEVYTLYGSGKNDNFSFSRPKKNRIKKIKNGTAWKSLFPLFNKKEHEPFDQEYVYPGNNVKVFDYNGIWIPAKINVNGGKTGDVSNLKAEVSPVPYYVRNWQSIKHKEHAQEFAEHNFWQDNKYFFMVLITAGLCLGMVGLTVYFTYNYATGGVSAAGNLADALRNFNVGGGVMPG